MPLLGESAPDALQTGIPGRGSPSPLAQGVPACSLPALTTAHSEVPEPSSDVRHYHALSPPSTETACLARARTLSDVERENLRLRMQLEAVTKERDDAVLRERLHAKEIEHLSACLDILREESSLLVPSQTPRGHRRWGARRSRNEESISSPLALRQRPQVGDLPFTSAATRAIEWEDDCRGQRQDFERIDARLIACLERIELVARDKLFLADVTDDAASIGTAQRGERDGKYDGDNNVARYFSPQQEQPPQQQEQRRSWPSTVGLDTSLPDHSPDVPLQFVAARAAVTSVRQSWQHLEEERAGAYLKLNQARLELEATEAMRSTDRRERAILEEEVRESDMEEQALLQEELASSQTDCGSIRMLHEIRSEEAFLAEQKIKELHSEVASLRWEFSSAEAKSKLSQIQATEVSAEYGSLARHEAELVEIQEQLTEAQQVSDSLAKEREKNNTDEKQYLITLATTKIEDLKSGMGSLRLECFTAEAECEALQSRLLGAREECDRHAERERALSSELPDIVNQLTDLQAVMAEEHAEHSTEVSDLRASLYEAQEFLASALTERDDVREHFARERGVRSRLEEQLKTVALAGESEISRLRHTLQHLQVDSERRVELVSERRVELDLASRSCSPIRSGSRSSSHSPGGGKALSLDPDFRRRLTSTETKLRALWRALEHGLASMELLQSRVEDAVRGDSRASSKILRVGEAQDLLAAVLEVHVRMGSSCEEVLESIRVLKQGIDAPAASSANVFADGLEKQIRRRGAQQLQS